VYFSNTFSYEQRYQTEDRVHRIGLKHSVLYIDLEAVDTVDERIRDVLMRSTATADEVLGDSVRKTKEKKSCVIVEEAPVSATPVMDKLLEGTVVQDVSMKDGAVVVPPLDDKGKKRFLTWFEKEQR
jgi:hypothetical protein